MREYSPEMTRYLMELTEDELYDAPESIVDRYIEERRYEYRDEWFEFLEALDKE